MSDAPETGLEDSRAARLRELAAVFLRLGTTAFGGPAAHIALMQEEVVVRRKWVTDVEFLDMLAATNFIPGPNSTEMSIHLGYKRAGLLGLVVAGSWFIVPAALLCVGIAMLYVRFGELPISKSMLYGVKPVVIAIVVQALLKLGKGTVRSVFFAALGALVMGALWLGVNELAALFAAGVAAMAGRWVRELKRGFRLPMLGWPVFLGGGATTAAAGVTAAPLGALFLVFLKIGSVLFGSGYVLLAFLRSDLVERYHWMTEKTLLDAIAVGQVTPGPVFTTATFIGYVLRGPVGALLATLGIFLPAFFFVAVSAPLLPRLRGSPLAAAFLNGLNVASLALMAVVTIELSKAAVVDGLTVGILVASAAALLLWKSLNSAWLVLAGAALGIGRVVIFGA